MIDVLSRPKLAEYVKPRAGAAVEDQMRRLGEWHADITEPPALSRDPKDDYRVALALDARAEAITSGYDDLHASGTPSATRSAATPTPAPTSPSSASAPTANRPTSTASTLPPGLAEIGIGTPILLWADEARWADLDTGNMGLLTDAARLLVAAESTPTREPAAELSTTSAARRLRLWADSYPTDSRKGRRGVRSVCYSGSRWSFRRLPRLWR